MKVAINVPRDVDIWKFHTGLIRALLARNIDVAVICSPGEYRERVQSLGVIYIPVELERFLNPASDIKLLWSFYHIFRREKFDIVHNHTHKPNIYGTLAAKLAGVRTVLGSVHGLGSVFNEVPGLKRKVLMNLTLGLYKFAFRFIDRVQFLNPDDLNFFVSSHMVSRDKAVLIKSIGVDLDDYTPELVEPMYLENLRSKLGIDHATQVVTMVARAYWSKGVREFVTATEMIGPIHRVKFLLVGPTESGPDAVPLAYLKQHESETFRWLDFRDDIRELLALSDVAVLPSYYPEGVPRSLLEAMAMGKPIVTTDNVGCREVVDEGRNGYLVPVRDSQALAKAIGDLLGDEKKRERFGRHSRMKVEAEFDEQSVVDRTLKLLYAL
jgi:N,N'-diacetylbacillosaminyl-diphospho-undecaprenol alpha-1,3-N-acetylgalactosaminyltransferase